jgi:hypothetical protein
MRGSASEPEALSLKELPFPQPELDPKSRRRGGLSHTCTARSRQCQQCFPLDDASSGLPIDREIALEQSTKPCIYKVLDTSNNSSDEAMKYSLAPDERFMPDPMKRPPISRFKFQQPSSPTHTHKHSKYSSPLPPVPMVLDTPCPISESVTNCGTSADSKLNDKDIFRGLHVATAAACDEDVDKWIEEIMGCGVRRFLADLSAFEGLGTNALATVARRAAKQRRDQVRTWEKIREHRLEEMAEDLNGMEEGTRGNKYG